MADDIVIVEKGEAEADARRDHDNNLVKLLQCAREKNIKLNMRLHMHEITYIGHVLSPDDVNADPDKVSDIKNMHRRDGCSDSPTISLNSCRTCPQSANHCNAWRQRMLSSSREWLSKSQFNRSRT